MTFIKGWLFIVSAMLLLRRSGGFAVIPFRRQFPFAFLLAPLFGIGLVTLGSLGFYVLLKVCQLSLLMSAGGCLIATALGVRVAGAGADRGSIAVALSYGH